MSPWLPGVDAPVWGDAAGAAVLALLLLPLGYYMMRHPTQVLSISHVTTVEDDDAFTGFAVARQQAVGFFTAALGVSTLWFLAVSRGVPPVVLPLGVVGGGVAAAISARSSDSRVQYLGIGLGVVAGGSLLTLLFVVVAG